MSNVGYVEGGGGTDWSGARAADRVEDAAGRRGQRGERDAEVAERVAHRVALTSYAFAPLPAFTAASTFVGV
jgi:hypothetical protein